jgi:protein-tyrosine phosphatase
MTGFRIKSGRTTQGEERKEPPSLGELPLPHFTTLDFCFYLLTFDLPSHTPLCYHRGMKTNSLRPPYSRSIDISFVGNLRDLGGYGASNGRRTAWRKVFRSAEIKPGSEEDVADFRRLTGVVTVLDLRGDLEIKKDTIDLLAAGGIRYYNVPLIAEGRGPGSEDEKERFSSYRNMGQFYLYLLDHEQYGRRMVTSLEFIANSSNHPILFHCAIGKDRTGVLAAAILSLLGVAETDIIADYRLTTPFMKGFTESLKKAPQGPPLLESLPAYVWEASQESMELVLSEIKRKHGSFINYLEVHGAGPELFTLLESVLLEPK